MAHEEMGKELLALIQAYRGFAAVLVVVFHACAITEYFFGDTFYALDFGASGVQFFFVLSGFIIFHVHRDDIGTGSVGVFARKRATRIYPLYILVTLALAAVFFLVPGAGQPYHRDPTVLLLNLLLLPHDYQPHVAVAWTLVHEVIFYALFATLIMSRKVGAAVFALWFCAVIAAMPYELTYPTSYFLSTNNLLFGFGMLLAWSRFSGGMALFIIGNVAFVATDLMTKIGADVLPILSFGIAATAILSSAPRLDEYFRSKYLALLGDASYAIYLTHFTTITIVCKVFQAFGAHSIWPAFAASIVISIAVGTVLHTTVEAPLLKFFRRPKPLLANQH